MPAMMQVDSCGIASANDKFFPVVGPGWTCLHFYVELNREQAAPGDSSAPTRVTETSEKSEHSPGMDEL